MENHTPTNVPPSPQAPDRPSPTCLVRAPRPVIPTAIAPGTVTARSVCRKAHDVATNIDAFSLAALAWILGGVLALLGSLAYAEVCVLYPRAGGNYVFLREGFGRLAGFLWGWVEFWIIRAGSLAALATIFTESFHAVIREAAGPVVAEQYLGFWMLKGLTVAVILGLGAVNVLGVRWGGLLQLLITIVKVGSLVAIIVLPFLVLALGGFADVTLPRLENLRPVWP